MHKTLMVALLAAAGAAGAQEAAAPETQPASTTPEQIVAALGEAYAPLVEPIEHGRIDWTRGQVIAQGQGKVVGSSGQAVAKARRAARLVAARNAILAMRGIRVDAKGRFADVENGQISAEGVLRDFEESAVEYDPKAGTVTVTMRANLYGFSGLVRFCGHAAAPKGPRWQPEEGETDRETTIDVVVVETRGGKFSPVMYPAMETLDGQRVFDCGDLSGGQLRRRAMAIYAARETRDEDGDASERRLATLVLQAEGKDAAPGTLVIERESLEKLAAQPAARQLMRDGKLVIVTGKE